ncbi:hypothetical protein JHK82_021500 [Glycine max]|uniref:Uncharacterized protein n=1 Tax=Glycine max TaxID=3847 RepID=I1KTR7_SOYBN|nr:hypothetical protein JHK85_021954 [Glycine max]KAG5025602.1 hypothetical protein JHK86_021516 [Glycine max]KAG5136769.1 hypothetical protein JHK82_021500 [Glycine max]KAH1051474.1 hypothetical protein GYH30_021394 [Glycine max]KRH43580.1 hypothetical protein GLYMA_08G158900v4 [Glycine max]
MKLCPRFLHFELYSNDMDMLLLTVNFGLYSFWINLESSQFNSLAFLIKVEL